ncbi:MAG: HD domain-containing protein [Deltaproteobacteria bacterium]|nr:HD domain-containing protein [Deltaproteobacteria bacterium]
MSQETANTSNQEIIAYKDFQDYRENYNNNLPDWACHYAKASRIGTSHKSQKYDLRLGYRTEFQRDRDDILYSPSFRQLSYKRQMFSGQGKEYFFTRLTHTLIVAQIARSIARALQLDEFLTEAIALAHDIGHSPYGHSGEDGINMFLNDIFFPKTLSIEKKEEIVKLTIQERIEKENEYNNSENKQSSLFSDVTPTLQNLEKLFYCIPSESKIFDHHKQGYRLLKYLDKSARGLELTLYTYYGILRSSGGEQDYKNFHLDYENISNDFASYEVQVVRIADDIAWTHHDLGWDLQTTGRTSVDALDDYFRMNGNDLTLLDVPYQDIREFLLLPRGEICGMFISDIIERNKDKLRPKGFLKSEEEGGHSITLSSNMQKYLETLRNIVVHSIHETKENIEISSQSKIRIKEICEFLHKDENFIKYIDENWYFKRPIKSLSNLEKIRAICDFVSFMSDSKADNFYSNFIGPYRTPAILEKYYPLSE